MFELGISSQIKTGSRPAGSQTLISEDHLLSHVGFWVIFIALSRSAGLDVALQDGFFPKGLVGAF